jgi:hypothetical protein
MSVSRLLVGAVFVAVAALGALQAVGCDSSGSDAVTTGTPAPISTESTDVAAGADLYPAPVEGKWGYIDKTGAWVIEPRFGSALESSHGLAPARPYNDWQWGYIDTTGEFVIAPQFAFAHGFGEDGVAAVGRLEAGVRAEGYIDKTGKNLTEEQFDETWSFSEGLGLVRRGDTCGYIDAAGQIVIPLEFYFAEPFSEGLAAVRAQMGELFGYIDKTGAWVIEPQFADAGSFSEGLARIKTDAGYGFIDKTGQMVIQPQFDMVTDFSEGLAVVSELQPAQVPSGPGPYGTIVPRYDKYGYIDTTGKLVIGRDFDSAGLFSSGLAAVSVGGKSGYIDKTGAWVIEPRFDGARSWSRELAMVCLDGETDTWAYIDKTGKVLWGSGPGAFPSTETSGARPSTTLWSGPPTSTHGLNDPSSPGTT